jgi:ABC-type oligopeptide transport system substrate-binding subunit
LPDYDASFTGLAYDPAKARQLLASSKYGQPGALPPVVLAVSGVSGHMPDVAGAVLGMIEENLGITVTVEQVEWSAFLQDLNQRRYQLFSAGWIGDYPDAQDFLDLLFHSGSAQNHTGYANTQVDQLLEQARVEQVAAKRSALYRQAERMIISDAPWIPLTHGITYTLVKPYVRGFAPSAALYPWLRDISIQK